MRIGMLAPITHPYPPSGYGPWERVTHDLTERLVADGHDVTLFAADGSITQATLVVTAPAPLSLLPERDHRRLEDEHIAIAFAASEELDLDLVHSHLHVHALRQVETLNRPLVTTLHGAAWDPAHREALLLHRSRPFVSLSSSERHLLPDLNYVATIPNGIAMADFPLGDGKGDYLVFVGRIAPEKAPHLAVEVARLSGRHLILAGPLEDRHMQYGEMLLSGLGSSADFVGPLDRPELSRLLGDAHALVMPLQWDEPFGLVVVESLASGTPVIAWNRGAMPEIIHDGVTGYVVDDVVAAVSALARVESLSREVCALSARSQFSDKVMARQYSALYERLALKPSRPASTSRT